MDAARLHRLARELRATALEATRADEDGAGAITGSLVAVVEDLSRSGPTGVTQIAARTGVAQSQVSQLIVQLRQAGLVDSASDPADGRRRVLTVSPRGRALLRDRGAQGITDVLAERHPHRSPAWIARTERLLDELADRLVGPRDRRQRGG